MMETEREKILEYWNDDKVQSMYDKHLISLEIDLIKRLIRENTTILDAGCGEGEGTREYAKIKGVRIIAADYSDTRLKKAAANIGKLQNVEFRKTDFLSDFTYHETFDHIITQRFLINLVNLKNQKDTLFKLSKLLKPGGSLILLEGSADGTEELNAFRAHYQLGPIDIPWHNVFFKDAELEDFAGSIELKLESKKGLGPYYLLTRAVRPYFDKTLNWDAEFNNITASLIKEDRFDFGSKFSRTKLWHFVKK